MYSDDKSIRVRFAPSPTGHLHVGGARTALFNYLYARMAGGAFILRIEDTDVERSTEESYQAILEGMRWLGLNWDEGPDTGGNYGPYLQSARDVLYHSEAKKLIDRDKAYYCFCTPEELEAMKFEARQKGLPPRYPGKCRNLSPGEVEDRLNRNIPHVIRFRMPEEGEVRFRDKIRENLTFSNSDLDDFVLVKSDRRPTYNFAVVVDDAHMKISHVIRGDDHISNTPRQIHLYRELGYKVPKFAHLPMILGSDGSRLSKRHGATSIQYYRKKHYLPDAMVNYLALLGWSYDGKTELFSRKALIKKFSLNRVSRNPAIFDMDKMEWVNAEHFKRIDLKQKAMYVYEILEEKGYLPPEFKVDLSPVDLKVIPGTEPVGENSWEEHEGMDYQEFQRLLLIVKALGNRLKLLKDVPRMLGYFYTDDYEEDESAVRRHLLRPEVGGRLNALADELEKLQYFDYASAEEALRGLADRMDIQAGELIHPCRVALTGKSVSPDIFWVVVLLGKSKSVERLRRAGSLSDEKGID